MLIFESCLIYFIDSLMTLFIIVSSLSLFLSFFMSRSSHRTSRGWSIKDRICDLVDLGLDTPSTIHVSYSRFSLGGKDRSFSLPVENVTCRTPI